MKLSTLYTTVPDYIEFGWVTAPTDAEEVVNPNVDTKLTITTEVADTGNLVSAPSSNDFTLPAGTYYFEANAWFLSDNFSGGIYRNILSLKTSSGTVLSRGTTQTGQGYLLEKGELSGQFVLSGSTAMALYMLTNRILRIGGDSPVFTVTDPNADQRTTIKLWKLK